MSAPSFRVLALWPLAAAFLAAPATAQWSPLPSPTAPPARSDATLTWHDGARVAVLFGGGPGSGTVLGDCWLHDGIAWHQLGNAAPPARRDAAAAYDSRRHRIVVFGGKDGLGAPRGDAWTFDGSRWQPLAGAAPAARFGAAMAYDARRDRQLLVGGAGAGGALGDCHEHDGSEWQQVSSLPVLLAHAACAYDGLRAQVVLFGGNDGSSLQNAIWAFDGSAWRQLAATATAPPARQRAALVADDDRGVLTLFGGEAGGALGDSWEFDGVAWRQLGGNSPGARAGASMAFDPQRRRGLLFGGSAVADTWALVGNPRPFASTFGAGCDGRTLDAVAGALPQIGATLQLDVQGVGSSLSLVLGGIGLSAASSGGQPLPRPLPLANPCCQQLVDFGFPTVLPGIGSVRSWSLAIPNAPALVGLQCWLQAVELETVPALALHASNGVELRLGSGPQVRRFAEDFSTSLRRDADASGGGWGGGSLTLAAIGGDGRHGSFDPTTGIAYGTNQWLFYTDLQVIPGSHTLDGEAANITDGRFYFTDFVVPAGTTIVFLGAVPPQIFVRGRVQVDGHIWVNAQSMTTFVAWGAAQSTAVPGQPGGAGGPGGAAGGKGGDRCLGLGPQPGFDGRPGQDVRLPAGHAYAAQAAGTGGRGSRMFPATGLMSGIPVTTSVVFSGACAPGGSGGGFWTAGGIGAANTNLTTIVAGPAPAPGATFLPFPLPGNVASIDHFLIGGSGGGGGGSHPFNSIAVGGTLQPNGWQAGAGGSGGGGALLLRSGGRLRIGASGQLQARGGAGATFSDRNSTGNPSPGGGGSGGSLLLQSGEQVEIAGSIDTAGGPGSQVANVSPNLVGTGLLIQGGAGAPGMYRLESLQPPLVSATSLVPALDPARHLGLLIDRDLQGGARSLFVPLPTANANVARCVRYELDVDVHGVPQRFSDDPTVGPPADDPHGPVQIRFQAGRLAGGSVQPSGPWRASFGRTSGWDDLDRDLPTHARFDVVLNAGAGPVVVRAVRLYCR